MALPVSKSQAEVGIRWMKDNYENKITAAVAGTPFTVDHICGIFCQETLYRVILWIGKYNPDTILSRCVFDASGDFPGTTRSAFPKNAAEFESKYGADALNMLIDEGNKQRAMPQPGYPKGFTPALYLYKGYGIFQNDLQNIVTDEDFFLKKKWYNFDDCLAWVMKELNTKYKIKNDIAASLKAYNGSGPKADIYRDNVLQFTEYAQSV